MGISKGYVSKPRSPHPAYNLPRSQANILINDNSRACLADFSLLTVAPDQSTVVSSCIQGGTIQWMSPELLDPERFGLVESPNEGVGLLRAGDGGIRSTQRADTIRPVPTPPCHLEGSRRPASWETPRKGRGTVHRRSMGGIGALLEAQTRRADECQGCPSVS